MTGNEVVPHLGQEPAQEVMLVEGDNGRRLCTDGMFGRQQARSATVVVSGTGKRSAPPWCRRMHFDPRWLVYADVADEFGGSIHATGTGRVPALRWLAPGVGIVPSCGSGPCRCEPRVAIRTARHRTRRRSKRAVRLAPTATRLVRPRRCCSASLRCSAWYWWTSASVMIGCIVLSWNSGLRPVSAADGSDASVRATHPPRIDHGSRSVRCSGPGR